MKWQGRRQSSNVDDRRMGRGGRMTRGAATGGVGAIVILAIMFFIGGPEAVMDNLGILNQQQSSAPIVREVSKEDEQLATFSKVVLADTEDVWHKVFKDLDKTYKEPTMVIYSGRTNTGACGIANSAVGPFYCPGDHTIYIDMAFYNDMRDKLGASGDFAFAYVIAHEVGHHVQTLLGVTKQLEQIRSQVSRKEYNRYSVAFELQADYLAGVYARYAQKMGYVEEGDLKEAMEAAHAVGDDRIQKQSQGYVVPDSFTHGTSEQRMYWFSKGFEAGDLSEWDTFKVLIK